jgi:mannose-6-phosphate isomerase-like protein (cupin superfamily)
MDLCKNLGENYKSQSERLTPFYSSLFFLTLIRRPLMRRRSFLKLSGTAIPAAAIPFSGQINQEEKERSNTGFAVDNGKDRNDKPITLLEGDVFYTKIASADTEGDVFIFESTRKVNGGPPLHYHPDQDEWFYILSGEFLIQVGDKHFTAKAGDSAFAPRKVHHAFSKTGEGEAKMLIMFQPALKMEMHFKAVSEGLYKNLTADQKRKVQEEHGVFVVGPALGHEK